MGPGQAEYDDPDLQWARLLSFHEAGFLCGASCGRSDGGEAAAAAAGAMGLLTEHAYSVYLYLYAYLYLSTYLAT